MLEYIYTGPLKGLLLIRSQDSFTTSVGCTEFAKQKNKAARAQRWGTRTPVHTQSKIRKSMAKHGFSIIVLSWALMGPQAWFGVMVAGVGSLDNPGSIGSVRVTYVQHLSRCI